jgi:hypothetical protein
LQLSFDAALERAKEKGLITEQMSWDFIRNEIIGWDVLPINLRAADLRFAKLDCLNLLFADCQKADFSGATLSGANFSYANLSQTRFFETDLCDAWMYHADLTESVLVRTNVEGANFHECRVFGISVWDLIGAPRDQTGLLVTPDSGGWKMQLKTNGLALAPLVYFIARTEHAADVIETYTARTVLLLGNFKPERKAVLEAVGGALKDYGFIPTIFDFEGPPSMDTTGTVEVLARLSNFIVADITDPSSVPHELGMTVPYLRTTPVLLLRQSSAKSYSMVVNLEAYPWVRIHKYESPAVLIEHDLLDLVRQMTKLRDSLQHKEK